MGIYMQKLQPARLLFRRLSIARCLFQQNQNLCHYDVLEIPKNATKQQIRLAYLKKTKEYHPDNNHGDASLHDRFIQVTEAYEVLYNEHRRKLYDRPQSAYCQHVNAKNPAKPFGSFHQGEAWSHIDEETKQKMCQEFYQHTYPKYRQAMQEHYQRRKSKNRKIVYITLIITFAFAVVNFLRVMSHHRDYQQRMAAATAQNAALLQDPKSGYRAYLQKFATEKKE